VTGGIDESAEASGGRSVRVEFQVTQHEFTLFTRWLLVHLPGLRWLAALMLMLLAAGATLIAIVSPWIGAVLVGLVGLQFALWGWLIATTPRRAWLKRGAEAGANQVLEFSDQGVHVQTVNTDSMAKWPFTRRPSSIAACTCWASPVAALTELFPRGHSPLRPTRRSFDTSSRNTPPRN
jgi:hypothetical protein